MIVPRLLSRLRSQLTEQSEWEEQLEHIGVWQQPAHTGGWMMTFVAGVLACSLPLPPPGGSAKAKQCAMTSTHT
jgi:hypothetical protein